MHYYSENEWAGKGATLSHQTAMKEFGLTEREIFEAINQGKLQFRENNIYGNPFFRLIRSEVETLVKQKHGASFLEKEKLKNELKKIEKEIRSLKLQIGKNEKRKNELLKLLGN